ncbi:hypothetical protein HSBAA_24840 [Vreelandella sulfidaeris]|uniref:Cell division protein FtsZ C-terminal domain-containing protein n=1 Tax=Vreelandella sulfidaeris TaxID=115553 RepID=A0A455UA63_9GAMM|nr:hypothetical protein HSBAA_24840 [Halomonas sulfidaeris]
MLLGAVQGIAELITSPGIINVDFADVRTVMSEMGMAMMGTGGRRVKTARVKLPKKPFAARYWKISIFMAHAAFWSTSLLVLICRSASSMMSVPPYKSLRRQMLPS